MIEENEVLLKSLEVDVQSKVSQWTYSPKCHSGRMVRSITADVWPQAQTYSSECDMELYFY
jgi:hypothetical protein